MDKSFIFSDVIHTYTTKEAINDGNLIKVIPSTSEEAGIIYPVLLTRAVWERYVEVSKDFDSFQDEDGRLWDILYMFRYEAKNCSDNALEFQFICQIPHSKKLLPNEEYLSSESNMRQITLSAQVRAFDFDDPSPAIFIMMPGED